MTTMKMSAIAEYRMILMVDIDFRLTALERVPNLSTAPPLGSLSCAEVADPTIPERLAVLFGLAESAGGGA